MIDLKHIYEAILGIGVKVRHGVPMSEFTSFKIGGNADIMAFPSSEEQLSRLLVLCCSNDIPMFILGNGSNLLVSDNGIRGIVINMRGIAGMKCEGDIIECGAGVNLSTLCGCALENSLMGLEFAFGIPGSVGGAVVMNAGAYGGEMSDVLLDCRYVTPDGKIMRIDAEDMKLGYRQSIFSSNGGIVTSVRVGLASGDKALLKAKMTETLAKRKQKQPLEFPSAGSVFKRPEGYFAGELIEKCGLKGKSIGGAQVSEKHAGFIINTGGATESDVTHLISYVRETVLEKFGVQLETEIKFI